MPLSNKVPKAKTPVAVPLPTERQASIVKMIQSGMTKVAVARSLNVSIAYIYNVAKILKQRGQWSVETSAPVVGTNGKEKKGHVRGIMGVSTQGGPSQVQLRNVASVFKMIVALQNVLSVEGDLPCLMRDSVGVHSKLSPLVVKDLDSWDVLGAPNLPPGVGNGSRVVVWE